MHILKSNQGNKNHYSIFSAPASAMLVGEYAVLYGYSAIATAIDKRIFVSCAYRAHGQLFINSSLIGQMNISWSHLEQLSITELKNHPFRFVLLSIQKFIKNKPRGMSIEIKSDFSHQVGLGSSAAVTVATIAALMQLQGEIVVYKSIYYRALHVVRRIQGMASGSDIAASIAGGIIHYSAKPFFIKKLLDHFCLNLIYSGYKTPTTTLVEKINEAYQQSKAIYKDKFQKIAKCVIDTKLALLSGDSMKLNQIFKQHHNIQSFLNVSDETLNAMLDILDRDVGVMAAKISGAGLGDCVIILGKVSKNTLHQLKTMSNKINLLEVSSTKIGLRNEKKID